MCYKYLINISKLHQFLTVHTINSIIQKVIIQFQNSPAVKKCAAPKNALVKKI